MKAYFDNAATTFPKPEIVYSFMDSFYRENGGNAGRGQYKLAASASKLIAETRGLLLDLLQSPNKEVVFAPSATIAMNIVLQGVIDDTIQNVFISPFEHNAVTRILFHYEKLGRIHVHLLPLAGNYQYDISHIAASFADYHPDLVIVSHASNVCGLIAPVQEIMQEAKKYDALTVIDLAQTAGLVPIHLGSEIYDYAVFAGHKTLYGPIGIGGIIKKKELMPEPILFGGTGIDSANQDMPTEAPARYEMGSQNIHALSGLYSAIKWFGENELIIRETEEKNHRILLEILRRHQSIKIIGPTYRRQCIGVVSCLFDDYSSDNIGDVLDRFEISVRTGLQCSPLAHKTLGTFPAGAVRFSVGYYTTDQDLTALEDALNYIEENS